MLFSITLREVISRLSCHVYHCALQLVYVIDSTALITAAFSIYRRFIHRDAMRCDATRLAWSSPVKIILLPSHHSSSRTGGLIAAQSGIPGHGICSLVSRWTRKLLPLYPNGIIICISRDMVSNFKR